MRLKSKLLRCICVACFLLVILTGCGNNADEGVTLKDDNISTQPSEAVTEVVSTQTSEAVTEVVSTQPHELVTEVVSTQTTEGAKAPKSNLEKFLSNKTKNGKSFILYYKLKDGEKVQTKDVESFEVYNQKYGVKIYFVNEINVIVISKGIAFNFLGVYQEDIKKGTPCIKDITTLSPGESGTLYTFIRAYNGKAIVRTPEGEISEVDTDSLNFPTDKSAFSPR